MTFAPTYTQVADRAPRRLAPGLGLTLGALLSLTLWGGVAYGVMRLIG
ncbi:MAG TPA: hypothetical protein VF474_12745 [Phenylobacterium sp.]